MRHPEWHWRLRLLDTFALLPARLQHRANGGRDWTCSLVPASGVSFQNGSLFHPDLTNSAPCVDIETSPHCDPLADLFNSGGSLWHSLFAEEPCDCGVRARLGFAHRRAHFEVFAHRIDLCDGRSLCSVAVDLNRLYARHREFFAPQSSSCTDD